jgi:prevent-host-death family protein
VFYNDVMAQIGIRELNQQTSQVLDRVKAGETLEVTDRGVPIAEIRPISGIQTAMARLIAGGRMIPATVDPVVIDSMSMTPRDDVNVAELLAADRENERW